MALKKQTKKKSKVKGISFCNFFLSKTVFIVYSKYSNDKMKYDVKLQ